VRVRVRTRGQRKKSLNPLQQKALKSLHKKYQITILMEFFVKIGGTRFSTFRKNRGYTFFDFQESKNMDFCNFFGTN